MTPTESAITTGQDHPLLRERDASPRPSTVRMRRLRERRKAAAERRDAGTVRVHFDLAPGGIDLLVELGWLALADRGDEGALGAAFGKFVNRAAAVGIAPEPSQLVEPIPPNPTPPPRPEWLTKMFDDWERRARG